MRRQELGWRVGVALFLLLVVVLGVQAQAGPGESPIATPTPAVPGAPTPVDPGSIPELPALLRLLAGPQGWIVLGVFVSMVLAKWPWYGTLPSTLKQLIFVGAVMGLSVAAYLLVTFVPAVFWAESAPLWTIIAGVVITWIGGNGWYALGVKRYKPQ